MFISSNGHHFWWWVEELGPGGSEQGEGLRLVALASNAHGSDARVKFRKGVDAVL